MNTERLIKKLVSENFQEIDYSITDSLRIDMVSAKLSVADIHDLKMMAISGEVKQQKRLRALESVPDQGSLWNGELMDVIIAFKTADGEPASIKYGSATADHHEQSRAHEIEHLRKAWKRFERQESRRKILMPILQENPGMTTKEALEKLGLLNGNTDYAEAV